MTSPAKSPSKKSPSKKSPSRNSSAKKKPQTTLPKNPHVLEKWSEQTSAIRKISRPEKKEYGTSPKRLGGQIIQLTPYYKNGQLIYLTRESLLKICVASGIKWSSDFSDADLRKLILDRQNKATKSSKYIFMSLAELKESAKKMGVGTSGTKQQIMNRIHQKLGYL